VSNNMNLRPFVRSLGGVVLGVSLLCGCSSKPAVTQSGFLSDYSRLETVNSSRMRYEAPNAHEYRRFIIEPVQSLVLPENFSRDDQQEATRYFRERIVDAVQDSGYEVVSTSGAGVARVRIALTDIAKSTWWQKIHPGGRAMGAGTGGAAMEAEVLDSVTGEQIGAVIQADPGNQLNLTSFSTLDDVKSAIDKWAERFADRLEELHG